jgi:hypothetical protein
MCPAEVIPGQCAKAERDEWAEPETQVMTAPLDIVHSETMLVENARNILVAQLAHFSQLFLIHNFVVLSLMAHRC